MPLIPIREAAMQRIATALETILIPVERNRRGPLKATEFPRLVLLEGGHTASEQEASGVVTYTMGITIEGYVTATEQHMGRAVSDLHAKIVRALVGQSLPFGSPADELWITETGMEVETASLSQAEGNFGNFTAEFEVELRSDIALGPFINV